MMNTYFKHISRAALILAVLSASGAEARRRAHITGTDVGQVAIDTNPDGGDYSGLSHLGGGSSGGYSGGRPNDARAGTVSLSLAGDAPPATSGKAGRGKKKQKVTIGRSESTATIKRRVKKVRRVR